jgi:YesN/AraC family two-component response regulator
LVAMAILALKLSDRNLTTIGDVKSSETSLDHYDGLTKILFEDFITRNKRFKQTLKQFEGEYLKMLGDKNTLEYAEAVLIELMVKMQSKCVLEEDSRVHYLTGLLGKLPAQKIQFFEKKVSDWFSLYAKMQRESFNPITIDAIDILQKFFSKELSLEEVSDNVNVTPQYLSKIFKEDTGITFKEFLTEQRIEAAKKLLKQGDISLKDIGHRVGYNDTSYFIRSFKKHEGITPKDYQRLNR